jgi:hypothetical protein
LQRRKTRTRARELGAAALAALILAGCGGTKRAAPLPQPPALPRALAVRLAAASDAVASSLAAGDSCRALALAHRLQAQTIAAINAHRVPTGLQEQLSSSVNGLVARVTCVPPPRPAPRRRPQHEDHKKREHHKRKGHD